MAGFNGMAIAKVTAFAKKDSEFDGNGKQNIILTPVAGKLPSKRIIAGTLALSQGLVPGDVVAVSFVEGEVDPKYGRQFSYSCLGRLTTMEAIASVAQFGEPSIVDVSDQDNPNYVDAPETKEARTEEKPQAELQENATA